MLVRLLGPVDVVVDGRPEEVGSAERRGLLAALALRPGRVVPFDHLVGCMWAGAPPRDVPAALRFHASRLRRALPAAVVARDGGYVLDVDEGDVDAVRFERALASGRARAATDPEGAAALLEDALGLWRGAPLTGAPVEPFAAEVRRLEELRREAVESRLAAALACGRHLEVVADLEHLVAEDPLRERAWCLLVTALYRSGRQADALAACQRVRRALAEDLGVEPSPELRELEGRVLRQDEALQAPPVPSASPAPAPPASPADGARRPGLPRPLSSFVGRDDEIAELLALLERRRLVTLAAPAGAGKTRLALEVARRAASRFPDGVDFADLAPARRAVDVARAVARAVGIADVLAEREGVEPTLERVAAVVAACAHLLVVDNCEHVVEAAADTLHRLLEACPELVVLATSRRPLDVEGEQLVPVAGLDLPDGHTPGAVDASAAGRLFLDRARSVRPDLVLDERTAAAVAAVCRRLDGLPLALELAAARTKVLSVGQVAERLDDAFAVLAPGPSGVERHRTMETALRWSHDLLDDPERALLARLSVFAGGFALDAVEAVAGDLGRPVLDVLAALVDRSLVVAGPGPEGATRYRLLEVVRQFAARELAERGETEEVRRRHRDHYLVAARTTLPVLPRGSPEHLRLAPEVDNVRAAVRWSLDRGDALEAASLVAGYACWFPMGLFPEGAALLRRAIDAVNPASADPVAHGYSLAMASTYAGFGGWVDQARDLWQRLGGLLSTAGEVPLLRARHLSARGMWEWLAADGDLRCSLAALEAAVHAYDIAGIRYAVPAQMRLWVALCLETGDDAWWDEAVADAVGRARAVGAHRSANSSLVVREVRRAAAGEAVDLARCDALLDEMGPPGTDFEANPGVLVHGMVHELVGDRGRALADARQHVWWCQQMGIVGYLPLSLRSAVRALPPPAAADAARLYGAYEAVTAAHRLRRDLPLLDRLDGAALAGHRSTLGEEAFERARSSGHGMGAAEAAGAALAVLDAVVG